MPELIPLGRHFRVERMVDLPEKVAGRHRWVLSCGYRVTDAEAAKAHEGVSSVLMGADRLLSYGIGCWDCEEPYGAVIARPCPVAG